MEATLVGGRSDKEKCVARVPLKRKAKFVCGRRITRRVAEVPWMMSCHQTNDLHLPLGLKRRVTDDMFTESSVIQPQLFGEYIRRDGPRHRHVICIRGNAY